MLLSLILLFVVPGLLILAAATDLTTMTIPNRLSLALVGAFALAAPLSGLGLAEIGAHLAAGAAMLAVAFILFAFRWIGGGDAKLFAATALWLGWTALPTYILVSTLLGGVLTLALLMARGMPLPVFMANQDWIARLHDRQTGVPYGIALAAGGLYAYAGSFWMGAGIG